LKIEAQYRQVQQGCTLLYLMEVPALGTSWRASIRACCSNSWHKTETK